MLKIYLGKEWDFFTRTNVALLMRDVAGESAFIRTSIVAPIVSTVKESLILLGIVSFLIYLQPKTTIIICVSLILLILLIKLSTFKMVKKLGLRRQETSGYLNKNLIEVFNLIKEIKILNKENYFYKDFKFINKDYIKVNKAFSIIIQLPRQLIELLGIFGIAAFLIIYSHYNDSLIDIIPYIGVFFAAAYKMLPGITKVLTASQSLDFGANALDLYVREFNLEKLKKNLIKSENSNKFDNFERN